jgi:ABC-2 type transport system permease protein
MLAQSLFGAARTLYLRGDLDLLLGSPILPRHVFAAKAAGIAAGSFGSIALLTLPVANAGALLGNVAWLTIYPTLAALTLIATALGLSLTIALFRLVGPRRARVWTQLTGAATAGAFVLGVQIATILPAPVRAAIARRIGVDADESGSLWLLARLPVEAVRGDAVAATILLAIAVGLFAAATALLGRHFAAVSLASSGTMGGGERAARARRQPRFRIGLTRNMRRKEWRLLVRDPGLFAQLSLQVIYTLPIAVVLLRNEHLPSIFALAPTIVVVAAQVSASLAWLTVSGEDAPELIATAPVTCWRSSPCRLQR